MWGFICAGQGSGCEHIIAIKAYYSWICTGKNNNFYLHFFFFFPTKRPIRLWGMILSRASCLCAAWNQSGSCLGLVLRLLRLGLRPSFELRLNDALNNLTRKPGWTLLLCRQLKSGELCSFLTRFSERKNLKMRKKKSSFLCRVQMQLLTLIRD